MSQLTVRRPSITLRELEFNPFKSTMFKFYNNPLIEEPKHSNLGSDLV